ncbi:UDP-N-acetylglucosamine--N-acetylmuramyl-(pentapeptide) pyrophosphoryl-undecaprenol N-acetylglucosamine transferase [Candidatus Peregrinibacteria bacterium]|nr:UDP-N-acetylglucosamine--N-acetylmuramyl-(pentapeptide) pyrophosphoryl-undecaprenol N-acetylglucosamine transferase [Candidatus Peregrinibacteria bacterium]
MRYNHLTIQPSPPCILIARINDCILPSSMKILLGGGGSAGHLAPLVAVWRAAQTKQPKAEALAICTRKESDADFLTHAGIPYRQISIAKKSIAFPFTFLRSVREAHRVLHDFRPDVVFSKGGAASVPVCIAARLQKIPIVLHESDAVSGRANRLVARWADIVCMGFSSSKEKNEQPFGVAQDRRSDDLTSNIVVTGNPIRPEVLHGSCGRGLAITGLTGERPILLILGGSQGAETFNAFVREHLDALLTAMDVVHLTGMGKTGTPPRPGYWSAPFVHEELAHLYAISDLALSRAGAGAISELAGNGIPMILAPLEGLAQDHQLANAQRASVTGGCLVVRQESLGDALPPLLFALAGDADRRKKLSNAVRALAAPNAATHLADILIKAVSARSPSTSKRA